MPQVKSYRRYTAAPKGCLGVISSGTATAFIGDKEIATATLSTVTIYEVERPPFASVLHPVIRVVFAPGWAGLAAPLLSTPLWPPPCIGTGTVPAICYCCRMLRARENGAGR